MIENEPTDEQRRLAEQEGAVFCKACPGSGKTRTMVARIAGIAKRSPSRMGVAVLTFTNSAKDEFVERCCSSGLGALLKFPSFIGTLDSFIHNFFILPGGIEGVNVCPMVVDSWGSRGFEEVRLSRGIAFHGPGVPLDRFDPIDGRVEPRTIAYAALRKHVIDNQSEYEKEALRYRQALRRKGYLSAGDARVELAKKMGNKLWAVAVGRAISARFTELIVDEAHDCNPTDLEILEWLSLNGLPVTVVCDPDQAIYGFRHGDPSRLEAFRIQYKPDNQIPLTGNFRSSGAICTFAATLRNRVAPDIARGPHAEVSHPIYILEYGARTAPGVIGLNFQELLDRLGLNSRESIVLAHKRNSALRAVGMSSFSGPPGTSKVEAMARAVGEFWSASATGHGREASLVSVEKLLLGLMGKIEAHELPTRAIERHGIDRRWLRRIAFELVMSVPKSCNSTSEGPAEWLAALHGSVKDLELSCPLKTSERTFFKSPPKTNWSKHLHQENTTGLRCSTIHEAKGREFDAVCVVIPPDTGGFDYTSQLFDSWESRTDYEGKRVIYVGVTRAKLLVALAVPNTFRERLTSILKEAAINHSLHVVTTTDFADSSSHGRHLGKKRF
jgi:superfamily I DNA/RNA helicase